MQETIGAILDRRFDTMVAIIAKERQLEPTAVKGLIDTALFQSEEAKAKKLVDDVVAFEPFRDEIKAPWTKLKLEAEHGGQLQSMMKLARFMGAMPADRPTAAHVAVIYALGNIVDGNGEGVLGARGQIASHTLVAALRAMTADENVKAVVLRIDSGGGSAQASELIWRAVAELKVKKPVIVSMSDVAASGGYISSATDLRARGHADRIDQRRGGACACRRKARRHTFPMGGSTDDDVEPPPWKDDERR
jgi:protease-4